MDETRDLDITERGEEASPEQREQPAVETPEQVQALVAERERLAEEKAFLYDQLLRKQAEFENFRRRTERERLEIHQYASMEAVREILPVLDALERALASDSGARSDFHAGVELIARQLWDTLGRLGVTPVKALGEKFDPHQHQAVEMVETDKHEDQTILEEWQRGYMFKNKLLRPAMVKVAVRRDSQ